MATRFRGRGIGGFFRKKPINAQLGQYQQLPRTLHASDLVAIGIGSTIGAGLYVIIGTVARENTGPALTIAFLIAGIAAALSAFCYAELASRCPEPGSAYNYAYVYLGEGVAWLIGWSLVLEYAVGGSAVARGILPNLAYFFGGTDHVPSFLSVISVPWLGVSFDPYAVVLVLIVTGLLCIGIETSSRVQAVITTANVCVILFVIVFGGYIGYQTGWTGYNTSGGYLPFGIEGLFAGSANVFFAYVGFDSVAAIAEEVRDPQVTLPWGIGSALGICCFLYMALSAVIVGLVPYYALDPDTPISTAFSANGMHWAGYVVACGTVLALCSALLGSILPQPRILLAMARDGLLPSFFKDLNNDSPVKSTIFTGIFAATLAFFLDVSQLAGMVSAGTLLAFTAVAVSILIMRYVPPLRSVDSLEQALLLSEVVDKEKLRCQAAWNIVYICIGIMIITLSASVTIFPTILRYTGAIIGAAILLYFLIILSQFKQDTDRSTAHVEGFFCPFVPFLPSFSILINVYLLINLGAETWLLVSVWLAIGLLFYLIYGRRHSLLGRQKPLV